ncbi:hypothetical protein [Pseudidiomarina gelatinasegens]|uniref:hypothetical protein n=1 Tax=Pseudidiomarina gelatinasegens TaxID=2487740 RepID=UPI003A9808F4
MKHLIITIIALGFALQAAAEPINVRVAAYEFPPYYSDTMDSHLIGEVLNELNNIQDKYLFTLERVAPNGRYFALSEKGCCDLMLFEDPSWGWQDAEYPVEVTEPLLIGRERFVAMKQINRGQQFFETKGLRFGGIVGYHYPFAANEKDNRVLEEQYGIYLTHSHHANLRMLMNGRLDLIMLADDFIQTMLTETEREQLLLSDKPYGVYKLRAVISAGKTVKPSEFKRFLKQLKQQGKLTEIFQRFHVKTEPGLS